MAMTKEEFKAAWDSDGRGDSVPSDDIEACYIAWGLKDTAPVSHVGGFLPIVVAVTKAAQTQDAEMWAAALHRQESKENGQVHLGDDVHVAYEGGRFKLSSNLNSAMPTSNVYMSLAVARKLAEWLIESLAQEQGQGVVATP